MNRLALAVAAWIAFGMELGLAPALAPGSGAIRPGFVLPLLVFVAMHAPARAALWTALVLGVGLDLLTPWKITDLETVTLVGPHALGCFVAAQFVLAMRGMVIHRNPLTIGLLTLLAGAIAAVVVVAVMTVRGFFPDPIVFAPTRELLTRLGSAAYTGAVSLVLAFPLLGLTGVFGFAQGAFARGGSASTKFSWSHGG